MVYFLSCPLPPPPAVAAEVLHGRDRLMDVPAVLRWLQYLPNQAVRVLYHASHEHGGFLLHPAWQHDIVGGLLRFLQDMDCQLSSM